MDNPCRSYTVLGCLHCFQYSNIRTSQYRFQLFTNRCGNSQLPSRPRLPFARENLKKGLEFLTVLRTIVYESAKVEQMKRYYLGEFEEVVLLTVAAFRDNAYLITITHEIIEQTGRSVRLNQVHAALERLEDKGMLRSKMGNASEERGGRQKRLFTITALGRRVLTESQQTRQHLWNLAKATFGKTSEI